jgi:flagellar protein FliO/FliZ
MFDTLFGEGQYGLKMVLAFIVVLALIALTAWLVRRFGSERLGVGATRGRQPRLAVIDAASVDGRRRLVLIRRDNVEHLMMIGGPTDVVVEANIVRGAQPRDAQGPRPPAATDTLPRAVPLGEGGLWPLQPEPAPPPVARGEPAGRALRPAPAPPAPDEHAPQWQPEPEPPPLPPQPAPRRGRAAADPLAGLAEELSRAPAPPVDQGSGDGRPARREPRVTRPQPAAAAPPAPAPTPPPPAPAADAPFNSPADQNLADMAQRLEAALRRPAKAEDAPRFAEPAPQPAPPDLDDPAPPSPQRAPARPARAEKPSAAGKSSLYDSLEQEMASLLGRPNKP